MMHRPLDQHMRLARRAGTIQHIWYRERCQRRNGSPGVCLAADVRETGVGDVKPAVFVDDGDVGGLREVEGVAADGAFVGEGEEAGDQGEGGGGDAAAGLEVAPVGGGLVSWVVL
jgi:hypothetical protein